MTDLTQLEWATAQVRNWGNRLASILDLHSAPVGIRFVAADQPSLERAAILKQHHHCQALAKAACGEHLLLSAQEIACREAATIFMLRHPRGGTRTGDGPKRLGDAVEACAGHRRCIGSLELRRRPIQHLHLYPLGGAQHLPDVIVLAGEMGVLTRVTDAYLNATGAQRWETRSATSQATCVQSTLIPLLERRLNVCSGCQDCQDAIGVCAHEVVVGFPLFCLRSIVEHLTSLGEKAASVPWSERAWQTTERK